jgi:hypothetical protein
MPGLQSMFRLSLQLDMEPAFHGSIVFIPSDNGQEKSDYLDIMNRNSANVKKAHE